MIRIKCIACFLSYSEHSNYRYYYLHYYKINTPKQESMKIHDALMEKDLCVFLITELSMLTYLCLFEIVTVNLVATQASKNLKDAQLFLFLSKTLEIFISFRQPKLKGHHNVTMNTHKYERSSYGMACRRENRQT